MSPLSRGSKLRVMNGSYAVLFEQPHQAAMAGRLSVGPRSLSLHGANRELQARLEVPYRDLDAVRRSEKRIGGISAIEFDCHDGDTITLASLDQPGTHHEILESLQRIVAAQV